MASAIVVDVVIFGGGIAGLWTLARLRLAGYRVLLLESKALGGVQSIASQGIIHGGTKYALTGNLDPSARAIGKMPAIWRQCLAGSGELDLRRVRVLSEFQYLWSTESLSSRLTGFFAGKIMQGRVDTVKGGDRPPLFDSPEFHGNLYRLQEPVLDTVSLLAELARQQGDYCFAYQPDQLVQNTKTPTEFSIGDDIVRARRLVLTAGAGNQSLLKRLGLSQPTMQLRPLHMLMARGKLPALHAHCLGIGATPRLTITSYPLGDGEQVWYIGGQIAEAGTARNPADQIAAGRAEIQNVLPWVHLPKIGWSGFRVERAEAKTAGGQRPDAFFVTSEGGVITAWPTKLAFAPKLAAEILARLQREGIKPSGEEGVVNNAWSRPPLARPPWERVSTWN